MTYPSEDQSAIDEPKWLKLLRNLVFVLLCVSIIAMGAVIFAAVRLMGQIGDADASSLEEIALPEDAAPVSLTTLADGRRIVIFQDPAGDYHGQVLDQNNQLISRVEFQ